MVPSISTAICRFVYYLKNLRKYVRKIEFKKFFLEAGPGLRNVQQKCVNEKVAVWDKNFGPF